MAKLTFHQGNGIEKVTLDDKELDCVTSLTITAVPGKRPSIELGLTVFEVEATVPGHESEIRVTKESADLLRRFGWIPPADHEDAKTYTTEELLAEQSQEN